MRSSNKGISVVVCTYNGASRLVKTLNHLRLQEIDFGTLWEVIIIDNASTDTTQRVVKDFIFHNALENFSLIQEPVPGKNYALQKGLMEANYTYLLICDDDNWLPADYLQKAFRAMESRPEIGLLGGKGEPVFEGHEPFWFKDFQNLYGCGSQERDWCVYGAGSIFRREVLLFIYQSGFQSVLTDKKGDNLGAGGDIELSIAISLTNHKVEATDELTFQHYMTANRLREDYVEKLCWQIAITDVCLIPYIYKYSRVFRKGYQRNWFWLLLIKIYLLIRNTKINRNLFTYSYEKKIVLLRTLGYLYGIFRNRKRIREGFKKLDGAIWIHNRFTIIN